MSLTYGFLIPGGLEYSKEFSEAIHALFGDGVTQYGGRYNLTLGGAMQVNLSTGCAIANGRYIECDEPFSLTFTASSNTGDRYDAVAAHVDYAQRKGDITVLTDIDPGNPTRTAEEYNCLLYVVRIRRGSSVLRPDDVQDVRSDDDVCGYIKPLSEISGNVLYVYNFLNFGIDEAVQRIVDFVRDTVADADGKIAELEAKIEAAGGRAIGDVEIFRRPPAPEYEWLLCDGSAVPEEYKKLGGLLGGTLPDVSRADDRYRAYIYAGTPQYIYI